MQEGEKFGPRREAEMRCSRCWLLARAVVIVCRGSGGGGEGAALLGVGHFGKTMKMENMIDSTTYAVKIIDMYQQHLRRLALRAAAAAAAAAGVSPSSAAGNYKGYSEMEDEEEGAAEVNVRVALRREARALGSVAHPRIVRCVG